MGIGREGPRPDRKALELEVRFEHDVKPETRLLLEGLVSRLCFSLDGVKDAALDVVKVVKKGRITLQWEAGDDES